MLIFYILPTVEVMYIVTVLAPCVVLPVRYIVRNCAYIVVKLCPNCVQTMSPFAHAPSSVIDQTITKDTKLKRRRRERSKSLRESYIYCRGIEGVLSKCTIVRAIGSRIASRCHDS